MPKTLLLADDSVTIQKVVGISFANEDVVLLTVDNGDDAIARAREARPDVVLADVVMPGRNGYDVCQAIKADPALAHIPVLLLTGTFEAFDEQRASRVGADGHITKPFEAQALVDKVNGLLSRPPASAAAEPARSARAGGSIEIGAFRSARASAPPPQPVSHTADTAYDFFDEQAPPAAAAAPTAAPAAPEPVREDTTVLIGQAPRESRPDDGGFAFDEFADTEREPALPPRAVAPAEAPAPARGIAREELGFELAMPGAEAESSLFDDFTPNTAAPAPEREDFATQVAEPRGAFEWDAPAAAPTPAPPAAEAETRFSFSGAVEPAAELAEPDWFSGPEAQGATHLLEAEPLELALPVASEAPSPAGDPFELDAAFEAGALDAAVLDPQAGRGYDVSSSDLGPPLVVLAPPPPVHEPTARVAEPAPSAHAPGAALGRTELHDALEKMAWEAFGPVAESLVRDAVERIERIAWEVIPQMAEAMIREEIRKLKGE
jgi:CheY-like chemotaxis protein